ncbi:hypothetical protein AB0F18_36635 [Streptomyces sp. NPDC029216]|uniref:ATP-dependent DNA ligase n=1 Tax=Streptomyces sp. NPDC029216 TaxID=3154701 RepID=UPI0033EC33B1
MQRRAAARSRGAAALAAKLPAHFVAFDVLQQDGQELLHLPYADRRARLENLFTERAPTAPGTLCPMATDLATAREWLETWTDVSGVEDILIKPLTSRYNPAYRGWTKIRRRDTTEAIIGAITGTLARPGRPWTGVRFASAWGSRDVLDVTLVRPDLVAEFSADRAVDQGIFRHPLRFRRIRLDVTAGDVPPFGQGAVAAAG